MSGSGTIEYRPEITVYRFLITDGQGDQDTRQGIALSGQNALVGITHHKAQTFDGVVRAPDHFVQTLRRIGTDVTAGPDISLKQPGFVIKPAWIGVSVRPFQADGKAPAFARTNRQTIECFIITPPLIPGKHDTAWHYSLFSMCCGQHEFRRKFETRSVAKILRQTGNHADHLDITSLPFGTQMIGHACLRTPTRPGNANGETGNNGKNFC